MSCLATWLIDLCIFRMARGENRLIFRLVEREDAKKWNGYIFSAALKFIKLLDPTLEHDLQGDRPWAL